MKIILTDTFISHTALGFSSLFPIVALNVILSSDIVPGEMPLGKGVGGGLLFKDITPCWFNLILNTF